MQIAFCLVLGLTPLVLWPFTSEVFEFNKMLFIYLMTIVISSLWLFESIKKKKVIFRRTILDYPILVFLFFQTLSTVFSIDPRTSVLGYYSRFNGGLLSSFCYAILYWAYVANIDKEKTIKVIRFSLLGAAAVSLYGIFEHFGIDKNLWVQDVKSRVFSTLGQPNWLATYLVPTIFLNLIFFLRAEKKKGKAFWLFLALISFFSLLFTKSRSGFLGFIIGNFTFSLILIWKNKKKILVFLGVLNLIFILASLVAGFPFSLYKPKTEPPPKTSIPTLETGGTESGEIRKIVWKGAFKIWQHYPILGSGVETFALSYYNFRPAEHNLTSEWDFLYNKAHNEYLNFLATTGSLGLIGYLFLIATSIWAIVKCTHYNFLSGLLAGYVSILVSQFFGFSVVVTQVALFLLPAMAISLNKPAPVKEKDKNNLSSIRKIFLFVSFVPIPIAFYFLARYFWADVNYAQAKVYISAANYPLAQKYLTKAISLNPKEGIFHADLGTTFSFLALSAKSAGNNIEAQKIKERAIAESQVAIALSPVNVNFYRQKAATLLRLVSLDPQLITETKKTLDIALKLAPTDAKIRYTLAKVLIQENEIETAKKELDQIIELKGNYKDARYLKALLLIAEKKYAEAKEELTYILQKIDPNDENAKIELAKLK